MRYCSIRKFKGVLLFFNDKSISFQAVDKQKL